MGSPYTGFAFITLAQSACRMQPPICVPFKDPSALNLWDTFQVSPWRPRGNVGSLDHQRVVFGWAEEGILYSRSPGARRVLRRTQAKRRGSHERWECSEGRAKSALAAMREEAKGWPQLG